MPELPEVETIRMQLDKALKGRRIVGVKVKTPKSFPDNKKKALGARVLGTRRFGKVLVIDLDNDYSLFIHLKLTGQLLVNGTPGPYTRVIINFEEGEKLIFNDLRIFGWMRIVRKQEVKDESYIKKLGAEPLRDLTLEKFKQILTQTRRPIKTVLMDQEKISGVGNIYANDALWLAKINPRIPARQLDNQVAGRLHEAILKVLKLGIRYGGASDQFYLDALGAKGHYQDHFLVYNRQGEKCFNCGGLIKKIRLAGRGTYFCPGCQK